MAHSDLTPLPGDPSALKAKADTLSSAAEKIQHAINQLRRLSDRDETVSQAVDKVRGKASDVADNITKAHVRYAGTAQALQEYAPKLEAAQERARRAINAHEHAQSQLSSAQNSLQQQSEQYSSDLRTAAAQHPSADSEPAKPFGQTYAGNVAHQAVSDATGAVQSAIDEYNAALDEVDKAAQHAIAKIKEAIDDSGLNDGFWDKVKHGLSNAWHGAVAWAKKNLAPILDVIQQVAEKLTDILSWVSMALNILAVFIPVLAPIAAAVDLITLGLAALSFLTTLALVGLGDRTWGDVLKTGITLVMSAMPVKSSGKALQESAEKIGSRTMSNLAEKMGTKMEAFGDKGIMKVLSKGDDAMSKGFEKLADFVGPKGAALGSKIGNKVGGYLGDKAGMDAARRAFEGSLDHGTTIDKALENAARQYSSKSASTAAAVEHQVSEAAEKFAKKATEQIAEKATDSAKDIVLGNGTNALDHYVFHQQDHHSSGIEISSPKGSTPGIEFVDQADGVKAPEINQGFLNPFATDWSVSVNHVAGSGTATLTHGG